MRAFIIFCLVIVLSVLLIVGVTSLRRLETGTTAVPGTDLSYLQPSAVPGHIEALESQDPSARKKAANILWQMGSVAKAANPTLLQATKDPEREVRVAAVKALGQTAEGTQDAIPGLIDSLKDEDAEVRATAARSLALTWRHMASAASSGAERRPPMTPPLRDEKGRRKENQPRRQGRNDSAQEPSPNKLAPPYVALAQKAVPVLTAALQDADARVRAGAAEALAETGPLAEPAVPDLVKLLQNDDDSNARLQATLALHNIGPGAKGAVPVLVQKLRSEKDDGVRVNTAAALGMIHASPETVVPALVETVVKDKHPDARKCAMRSIGQFGSDAKLALPLLQQAAKNSQSEKSEASLRDINQLLSYLEKQVQKSDKDSAEEPRPASQQPPSK
jgi:HEAT repeat protein